MPKSLQNRPLIPWFFLLGGYDLEMQEIRQMLEENGYQEGLDFLDFGLSWGACLSAYAQHFHTSRINVAIELTEDISPPDRYLRIDHHNDLQDQAASLLQVAALLQIPMTRWHRLVAANDAGYIPALQRAGASEEEIAYIRSLDRACQGVGLLDEELAERAIAENTRSVGDVLLVHALGSHFSPIADRLFGKAEKLLIFTEAELTYYGRHKNRLDAHFSSLLQTHQAYSGGGENGFWGIARGSLSTSDILALVEQIPHIV